MYSKHVEQVGEWVLNLFAVVVANVAAAATAPAVSTQLVIVVFVFCECLCAGTFNTPRSTHTHTHTQNWGRLRDYVICAPGASTLTSPLSALKISKDMKI